MIPPLAAVALAVSVSAAPLPDSASSDSLAQPRIVREFEPITVVGGRAADVRSIESVHVIPGASLRRLPVDRLVDAVALRAGVVALGEELHVRGGRTGELAVSTAGVLLNEPLRGTPMEVPLFAVRSAELLTGGLDSDHAGALAGELDLQTEVPSAKPTGLLRWTSDGRQGTGFDAVHARASTPLGFAGLGIALAGEARLDDLGLPNTRSRGREQILGGSWGWRQDNHLLAWAKLAPVQRPQRATLEVFASRVVRQPYNPMFDVDGWVSFFPDPINPDGSYTGRPLAVADSQLNSRYFRYRAADHTVMSEERRLATIATFSGGPAGASQKLAIGWVAARSLRSVGLRRDDGYVNNANRTIFGPYDYAWADPFHAYFGDESYFRDAETWRWFGRVDALRMVAGKHALRFGVGMTYDYVRLHQLDDAAPEVPSVDTLRSYRAWAPGTFAYVQHRWEGGGLIWNAGLRVSSFTAGPQARGPYLVAFQRTNEPYHAPTIWSWSPRIGFAYPVSDRDAFSFAYSRVFQDPPRDLLYDNRDRNYNRSPLGSGQLHPSEVISYQFALKHVLDPRWSLQLGAFYRDVFGQPGTRTFQPLPNEYRLRYESVDDAHAGGLEASLQRDFPGHHRLELTYTFMEAFGTQSNLEGVAYGLPLGPRPVPTGQHALDWDEQHAFTLSFFANLGRAWTFNLQSRVTSGLPWTPLYREPTAPDTWPPIYADQSLVNSRRMPWNENTNLSLRFRPPVFSAASVMLMVTNVFANNTDRLATLTGYPNSTIGTLYDVYSAHRTETGQGGGAFWNDQDDNGTREWVRVFDKRLSALPRTIRFGIEIAL